MNVSLNDHFDGFINRLIESGKYNSASEVKRDALRLLELRREEEQERFEYLCREIDKG